MRRKLGLAAVLVTIAAGGLSATAYADQPTHPEHPGHPPRPVPSPPESSPPERPLGQWNPYQGGTRRCDPIPGETGQHCFVG